MLSSQSFVGMMICLLLVVQATRADSCSQDVDQLKIQLQGVTHHIKEEARSLRAEIMAWVKEEIKTALEVNRETRESQISEMMTKIKSLHAENIALGKRMDEQETEMKKGLDGLQTAVAQSPRSTTPLLGYCAYTSYFNAGGGGDASVPINYDSLISEWKTEDALGEMDLQSGRYTVVRPAGFYTVSYSGSVGLNSDEDDGHFMTLFYLFRNKPGFIPESVPGGTWSSAIDPWSTNASISTQQQGGRILTIHLKEGDWVQLQTARGLPFASLSDFTFCVTLAAPDNFDTN